MDHYRARNNPNDFRKLVPILGAGIALGLAIGGCGLGYIDITPEQYVVFRIENGTLSTAEVTISTPLTQVTTGEEAFREDAGSSQAVIRVLSGQVSSGTIRCVEQLSVSATAGDLGGQFMELTGAGTGTPGFDSGSVGLTGERFLIAGTHFACADTVVIQLTGSDTGQIVVVPEGTPLPLSVITEDGGDTPGPEPTTDTAKVTFRLENATATPADITIAPEVAADDPEETEAATSAPVRVPSGEFTTGDIECGSTFRVTATMADQTGSAVVITGDGTGTLGFDSSSIGISGERFLAFEDHYKCGETIVVRITDDGSGIGLSTSETPLGQVNILSSGEPLPEPDLPNPEDLVVSPEVEEITLQIVNTTESTVQINFATGNGSLASSGGTEVTSQFDVRVPPAATTTGTGVCAQEYVIAGAHLEATETTYTEGGGDIFAGGGGVNYHAVVLTGDGTGTEGFDSSSIAVVRGRLLQLGTHLECGDVITVTITATNNQIAYDQEGNPVTDEYGNPTIKYNVGLGFVTVTSGG